MNAEQIAWYIILLLAGVGAALCFVVMWKTPHGIPGLTALDPHFRLPDLRFHYAPMDLWACLDPLGANGRKKLRQLWRIDFVFIACIAVVMWEITRSQVLLPWLHRTMLACLLIRAAMDVLENLLLNTISRKYPSLLTKTAAFCGYVTSAKWLALFAWVVGLFVSLFLRAFELV